MMGDDKQIHNNSMASGDASAQLDIQLQDEYIQFVQDRFGIVIKRNHRELSKTVNVECEKYHINPYEYLDRLKKSEDNSEMLGYLISSITIGETYFFRDKNQIQILSEVVLPNIISRKKIDGSKSIRIWSAGCSSGEEIYTIVMMLKDLIKDLNEWKLYLLATDINLDVLRKGLSGRYSEWSMRSIPDEYLNKYFTKHIRTYDLLDEIKKHVTFEYLNLNTDSYPSIMNGTTAHDLIICRNVLIYFDTPHIKKILHRLSQCIAEDGYIMLGASDPIGMMSQDLVTTSASPSLFVKKDTAIDMTAASVDVRREYEYKDPVSIKKSKVSVINRETIPEQAAADIPTENTDKKINELVSEAKWADVILLVDHSAQLRPSPPLHLTAKAMALANMGKTADAIKICEDCFKVDKINKEAYFLYALSLAESKRYKEAESAFKKALYIDPNYLICRYQFGLFLIHQKKTEDGIKSLSNAIIYARKFKEDDIVPHFQKMSYKELITVLTNEIELHQ